MMKQIYKYPLSIIDRQTINMPQGAQILSVQMQQNTPCVWCLVEPSNSYERRTFVIAGTGHMFDGSGLQYIGTVQAQGSLVWHVFEALP